MSDRHGDPAVDRTGQDEATILVGMLADQVDPSRGTGYEQRLLPKLLLGGQDGTVRNLSHDCLLLTAPLL